MPGNGLGDDDGFRVLGVGIGLIIVFALAIWALSGFPLPQK